MSEEKNLQMHTGQNIGSLNSAVVFDTAQLMDKMAEVEKLPEPQQSRTILKYQKLWFRQVYPQGAIHVTAVRITDQDAIIRADVYRDPNDKVPLSNFISRSTIRQTKEGHYLQSAQFEAQNQALTDAGFGIQLFDRSLFKEETQEAPTQIEATSVERGGGSSTSQTLESANKAGPIEKGSAPKSKPQTTESTAKQTGGRIQGNQGKSARNDTQRTTQNPDSHRDAVPRDEEQQETQQSTIDMPEKDNGAKGVSADEEQVVLSGPEPVAETADSPTTGMHKNAIQQGVESEQKGIAESETGPSQNPQNADGSTSSPETEASEMTLEEALNVVADVGSCTGKTLAQIAERRPTTLRWYFTTCPDSSARLKNAARIVYESLQVQKSA